MTPQLPLPSTSVHPHESNVDKPVYPQEFWDNVERLAHERRTPPDNPITHQRNAEQYSLRVGPSSRLECHPTPFRHSGWQSRRNKVRSAMIRTMQPHGRLTRFHTCGSRVHVYRLRTDHTRFKLRGNYCRDRFCLPCARSKATKIARNVAQYTRGMEMRFITLTVTSTTEDLPTLIGHVYDSFRRLRTSWSWKRYVRGSAVFLEIKYNPEIKRWHPHLHILADGVFYPHRFLKAAWYKATRGSYVVDLRDCRNDTDKVHYVTKYAGKAISSHIMARSDLLDLAFIALSGRRVCLTTGSFRSLPLLKNEPDDDWVYIDDLERLLIDRNQGHADAYDIIQAVLHATGRNGLITYEQDPNITSRGQPQELPLTPP